jgi:hypothetical protein
MTQGEGRVTRGKRARWRDELAVTKTPATVADRVGAGGGRYQKKRRQDGHGISCPYKNGPGRRYKKRKRDSSLRRPILFRQEPESTITGVKGEEKVGLLRSE